MKRKVKADCPAATTKNRRKKSLIEMDSDDILDIYAKGVAAGEKREEKKNLKMKISGKSVFNLKNIINKKSGDKH